MGRATSAGAAGGGPGVGSDMDVAGAGAGPGGGGGGDAVDEGKARRGKKRAKRANHGLRQYEAAKHRRGGGGSAG